MKTSILLRASFLAAALGAVLSAQAVTIALSSDGAVTNVTNAGLTIDETVIAQHGGFGPLATLHYFTSPALPTTGNGTYTGAGGTLNFNLSITNQVVSGSNFSFQGTWTATGGTGTYAGVTGAGVIATDVTVDAALPYDSFTIFRGDLQAVPEPASMLALGLGAAAMIRRRRKV